MIPTPHAHRYSVMATMKKRFKKYIVYKKDHNMLLMHLLQSLVKVAMQMRAHKRRGADGADGYSADADEDEDEAEVRIMLSDLEAKARDVEVYDLTAFLKSDIFRGTFDYDAANREIVKAF